MNAAAYVAFGATGFKTQLAYRVANWAGLFTNAFFLYFRAYFMEACYDGRGNIGGMDVADAVSYSALSQALIMVVPAWGEVGIAHDVRTGQIATDLSRPIDYYGLHMARRLGVSAYYVLVRCAPILTLAALTGVLFPPASWADLLLVVISVGLSAWIAHSILFVVELSSFWLESERGVRYLVMAVGNVFSGLLIPLAFFPDWLRPVADLSIFRFTLYFPTEVYTGVLTRDELAWGFALQLGWAIAITLVARAIFARGARRLTIHGG